jgi:hypothetical protein
MSFLRNRVSQIKSRTINNDAYANTAHYDVERDYTVNGLNQYTSAGPASFTYDDVICVLSLRCLRTMATSLVMVM